MKIGIVCYPTFGGSGVLATELGKELALKGHQVHFITYSQPVRLSKITKNIFYHEVSVSDYPLFDYSPYEVVLTSKIVNVAKYEGLDLLHVHYAIPHASAAFMARQILKSEGIDLPFVTTLHGTDITLVGKDAAYEPVITFAINQSDCVTAVSESLKEDTLKNFGVNRPINVVTNFVRMSKYINANGRELRSNYANEGERILLHISNFRPVKRIADVIKIFAKVNAEIPSRLLLVGDGPERARVEHMCRDLDICGRVIFLGKIKATESVLPLGDLFVLPSETESFGLAALEAMATGLPVITSNAGGLPEVNIDGVSGHTADVGDVDTMAEKAIHILKDEDTYQQYVEGAKSVAAKFDISEIIPQYLDLYQSILSKTKQLA